MITFNQNFAEDSQVDKADHQKQPEALPALKIKDDSDKFFTN